LIYRPSTPSTSIDERIIKLVRAAVAPPPTSKEDRSFSAYYEGAIKLAQWRPNWELAAVLCLLYAKKLESVNVQEAVTIYRRGLEFLDPYSNKEPMKRYPLVEVPRKPESGIVDKVIHTDRESHFIADLTGLSDLEFASTTRSWESSLAYLRADPALPARLLLGRARAFAAMPQYRAATENYLSALAVPGIRNNPALQVQALLGLAQLAEYAKAPYNRCAGVWLNQAMSTVPASEVDRYPQLSMALGYTYATSGKRSCATKHFQTALDIYAKMNDGIGKSRAELNLGILSLQNGDLVTAETLLSWAYQDLQKHIPSNTDPPEPHASSVTVWLAACKLAMGKTADVPQLLKQTLTAINAHLGDLRTDQGQVSYLAQIATLFDVVVRYHLYPIGDQPSTEALSSLLHSVESARGISLPGLMAGTKRAKAFGAKAPGNSLAAVPIQLNATDLLPVNPQAVHGPSRLVFKVLSDETLVFLVTPQAATKIHLHRAKLSRTQLRELIEQARKPFGLIGARRGSRWRAKAEAAAQALPPDSVERTLAPLSQALLEPVAGFLPADGTTLLIEPDDALWGIPFAALRVGGRYLVDRWPLEYGFVPSGRELAPAKAWNRGLIIGNPVMPRHLDPLWGAAEESKGICGLFEHKPGRYAQLLQRQQATWEALYMGAGNADVIHLATHGSADDDDPLESYVALAPSQARRSTQGGRIPLAPDDGLLTVEKLLKAKPQLHADLVVLSACESGLGQISSDGLVGLARAWLGVGAHTVLVSQWNVDDGATSLLMRTFYEQYLRMGTPNKSVALQAAMKAVRENPGWSSAPYWAPFLLIGAGELRLAPPSKERTVAASLPSGQTVCATVPDPPKMRSERIFFQPNETIIDPAAFPILDELIKILNRNSEIRHLRIRGHVGKHAPSVNSMMLSRRRAESVLAYLVEHGVERSRLSIGTCRPRASGATDDRVDFAILEDLGSRYEEPSCSGK
jgi:CHAT domain-containing protein/tetratricopeptide (TPR) repeat protein